MYVCMFACMYASMVRHTDGKTHSTMGTNHSQLKRYMCVMSHVYDTHVVVATHVWPS